MTQQGVDVWHAGPVAAVDVLVDGEVGLHRVHVAAHPVAVGRHPEGRLVAHGHVEAKLGAAARGAAVDPAAAHLAEGATRAELGLVADVANGAGQRAGAEQGPLGAAEHLHAGDVEQIQVRREQREGDGRVVQIGAHLLLDPRLVPGDLAGGGSAHGDLALAGAQVLHAEPGHVGRDGLDIVRAASAQDLRGGGGDGEGHVGQLLLAEHGRDGDRFKHQRLQHEVERSRRARRNLNVPLGHPSQAGQPRGDGVGARRQAGDGVTAVGGRGRAPGRARGLVRDRDGGFWHRDAAVVAHHTVDPTAGGLRVRRDAIQDGGQRGERQEPASRADHRTLLHEAWARSANGASLLARGRDPYDATTSTNGPRTGKCRRAVVD